MNSNNKSKISRSSLRSNSHGSTNDSSLLDITDHPKSSAPYIFHWPSYSFDFSLDQFYFLSSMASNNSGTFNNTSQLTNVTSYSQEKLFSEDEASDHLLYLIIPLYSLVFVIGTIGNILVILTVVIVKQMRNTTNALILHLAIANLSFVLMCIPHTIYVYVVHSYNFPPLLCKLANTLMYLSAYVSIYILVLMSIDRFLGVVYPVKATRYRTERNVHLAVIVVWLVGIIFASPNMIYYDVWCTNPETSMNVCLFRTNSPLLNTVRRVTALCFAILGLIVPLIIIALLYGTIIKVLRDNAKGKQVAKGKKRVTKMVSAVISSFVICWTPMQIYLLYTHHHQVNFFFAIFSQSLVYISACVNPILYAFLSNPFRQGFKQFLTCPNSLSKNSFASTRLESQRNGEQSTYRAMHQQSLSLKLPRNRSSMRKDQIERTFVTSFLCASDLPSKIHSDDPSLDLNKLNSPSNNDTITNSSSV